MFRISGAVLSAALLATTFAAIPSQAALSLQVSEAGGNSVTLGDNGFVSLFPLVADTNPTTGIIQTSISTSNGIFSNLETANITAAGSPVTAPGSLALNDFEVQAGKAGTITLALTNTQQTSPTGAAYLNQQFSLTSLTGDATVSLQSYEYNGNSPFNESGLSTPALTLSSVGGTANSSLVGNFTQPFTVTEVATIIFKTAGSLSVNFTGDLSSSPVPEPTSMMLFGTVLAGVCFVMRKRLQANS